eukprot:symbB.v1.2.020544.t1/scaffold1731.1/size134469/1
MKAHTFSSGRFFEAAMNETVVVWLKPAMCEVEGGIGPVPPGAIADGGYRKGPEDGEPPEEGLGVLAHIQLPVKHALDLKQERLLGVVTKYLPVSGYGMVKSHMFEGELTFRIDRIMPEFQAHPLHENEGVEFDVQADDQGKAVAVAVKPVLGRKPYDVLGQRHRGYVRRFAERWGFLNAAAFDGDLFVHRDNLLLEPGTETGADGQPILRTGQVVEFDVALDDRGRAVAKQITTRALLRPGDWIGHRLRGYIRSFQGAWGFINSDRFAGDLFVHRDSLLAVCQNAQLGIGTVVEFDIERDHHRKGAKNRLVARNVSVLLGEAPVQLPPMDPAYGTPGTPHSEVYPGELPPEAQPSPLYYQTYPYPTTSPYGYPPYNPYAYGYGQGATAPYGQVPGYTPPYGGNPYAAPYGFGEAQAYPTAAYPGSEMGAATPGGATAATSEAAVEEKAAALADAVTAAAAAAPKMADETPTAAPQINGEEKPAPAAATSPAATAPAAADAATPDATPAAMPAATATPATATLATSPEATATPPVATPATGATATPAMATLAPATPAAATLAPATPAAAHSTSSCP